MAQEIKNEVSVLLDTNKTLTSNIFARGKASVKNEIVIAKILLDAKAILGCYLPDLEKNKDKPYISKIIGKVEKKRVLELYFSPFVYVDYMNIKFKFKDFSPYSKKIDYLLFDNDNNVAEKSFKIKRKARMKKEFIGKKYTKNNLLDIDPKVWTLRKIDDIIETLYGKKGLKLLQDNSKNYNIERYGSRFNGDFRYIKSKEEKMIQYLWTPTSIEFNSIKELDSIVIFYTGKRYPLQAIYKIPPQSIPFIKVVYSFEKSGKIIIIARGKDGEIYHSKPFLIEVIEASDIEEESIKMLFNIK